MANISKIKISGASYSIKDENACKVVELTQAEYDALPASAKTSNSLFVITDATAGDLSNYYTKSETSGATEISTALESKADTATTYTKTETDNAITAATSTKQDTLVSGTNIKTINNQSILGEGNITIEGGSGGGKAIEAGRGISITTGETADTVSFNLPIYRDNRSGSDSNYSVKIGANNGNLDGVYSLVVGEQNNLTSSDSVAVGRNCITYYGNQNFVGGYNSVVGQNSSNNSNYCIAFGNNVKATYFSEAAFGKYNVSRRDTSQASASTIFSVGNGTSESARHNAFEIRQNGDIYISKDGQDVKLQDQLGGGGGSITIDQTLDSGSTNPVANSAITNAINDRQLKREYVGSEKVFTSSDIRYINEKMVEIIHPVFRCYSNNDTNTALVLNNKDLGLYFPIVNGKNIFSTNINDKNFLTEVLEPSAITTSVTSASTDSEIPSAKAVYDIVGNIETLLSKI